jgi:hypothetical protein
LHALDKPLLRGGQFAPELDLQELAVVLDDASVLKSEHLLVMVQPVNRLNPLLRQHLLGDLDVTAARLAPHPESLRAVSVEEVPHARDSNRT